MVYQKNGNSMRTGRAGNTDHSSGAAAHDRSGGANAAVSPQTPPPLVSIIMPTYNRAGWILETIDSIRRQTHACWELLIIDDGSDDDTEALVAGIGDERILFFRAGRTGINGILKNLALQKARGSLVAFIDSDDLWHPAKLERQVAALEAHPGAGFSLAGGYNFTGPGKPLDYFYRQRDGARYGHLFQAIFNSEIAVFIQALMMRKACLETTGLFLEKKSFSDADFILSLARHFPAVVLYEPLVFRRIHEANYIHGTWVKSCEEGLALLRSYRNDPLLPRRTLRRALFRAHIRFGEKYLGCGKRKNAGRQFFNAWLCRPFSIVPWKKAGRLLLTYIRPS